MRMVTMAMLSLFLPMMNGCTKEESLLDVATRAGAPLFDGMGDHSHPITSDVAYTQRYFD